MAVDRSSLLENAQRLAAHGQLEKAIEEWNKLATDSPTDGTIFNTIGDLHLKRNAPLEAIEAYFRAASAFQQRGFALKTIAVYKKILKIDPNRFEVYRHLGDLNAERGLIRNAIGDYLTVARAYLKEGNTRRSLELYRTIAKLDPTNVPVRQRVAELAVKEKLIEEAIAEYLGVAKECLAQQRPAEAQQAYRAILELNPDHREAQQGLSGPSPEAGAGPPPLEQEPELSPDPAPRPEPEAKQEAARPPWPPNPSRFAHSRNRPGARPRRSRWPFSHRRPSPSQHPHRSLPQCRTCKPCWSRRPDTSRPGNSVRPGPARHRPWLRSQGIQRGASFSR